MKKIKSKEDLELLKQSEFACVFFHVDGCIHCDNAKPIVEELAQKLTNVDFFTLNANEFTDCMEFYSRYAPQQQVQETVMDGDKPLLDGQGNVLTTPKFNADGTPLMEPVIAIPVFYVLSNHELEDDDYGFIGKIDGNQPDKLEGVLSSFVKRYKK